MAKVYELNATEQAFFDNVARKFTRQYGRQKGIIGVGVAFKEINGKLTDTAGIRVLVEKKIKGINQSQRIPQYFEGVPTDVVERDEMVPQLKGLLDWNDRGSLFDTVCGGIEITNRNLCFVNATVLGCIVYDKATGDPMGLTAQHGIGYVHKKDSRHHDIDTGCDCGFCVGLRKQKRTTGYLRTAKPGDPINQPNTYEEKNSIGELFKVDPDLDLALFRIGNKRKVEPRVVGIDVPINNPRLATIGMRVECSARHTHTRGTVIFKGSSWKMPNRIRLDIRIDPEYASTQSGDSGGLWLEEGTGRPVGIHTGISRTRKKISFATCISHLNDFHPVTFQPPKFRTMVKSLKPYHTDFAKLKDGFCVLRFRISNSEHAKPVSVVRYNNDFREVDALQWDSVVPVATGISATSHKNKMYCAWRSGIRDQIQIASIAANLRNGRIKTYPIRTRYRPALCSYKDALMAACLELHSETIDVAVSFDGKSFTRYDVESSKGCSAPTATQFGSGVLIAWVDKATKQIALKQVSLWGKSVYFENFRKIARKHQAIGDPYLTSGKTRIAGKDRWGNPITFETEAVYLGFTTAGGGLTILESHDGMKWKEVPNTAKPSHFSPTLFFHNDRVIWTRQTESESTAIGNA